MNKAVPQEKAAAKSSKHAGAAPRLRPALVVAALVVAAIVVRIVFLVELQRSELGGVLSLDSRFYDELARNLLAGGGFPRGGFDFNPLYPVFLVAVYRLFGEGLLAPRIVQLALGVLMTVLVYWTGTRLVEGPRRGKPSAALTAGIAALMTVLYGQFMLHEGLLLATTLEVFCFAATFALALALDQDLGGERPLAIGRRRVPPLATSVLLGAFLGAGALGRPNLFLLLVAGVPVWLALRHRRRRAGLANAAAVLVGAALFLVPPTVYNAKATGSLVPVTAHGGVNFYIGNRPGTPGIYQPPSTMRADMRGFLEDAKRIAESETHRTMSGPEVSDFFLRAALDGIRAHPASWLRLMGKKTLLFWNGAEVPSVPNNFFFEKSCGSLRLLFLPFSIIAPLGLCGFIVLLRSGRNRSVVSLFLACAFASVVLFFVNTRYRLPSVPLVILLAAFFVSWAVREVSRRRVRLVAALLAGAIAFFFLVSNRVLVTVSHSAAYAFLGNYYASRNEDAKAREAFAEAYRLDPNHIEAIVNYARILHQTGDLERSAELYAKAYSLMPGFPHLALEYGATIESLGRREEAKKLFMTRLSSEDPVERSLACRLLGQAALAEGKRDEALAWFKRALADTPGDTRIADMIRALESGR
jgi:Tfp pilus assembly protein PilF